MSCWPRKRARGWTRPKRRFEGKNLSQFIPWDKDTTFGDFGRSIWRNADHNILVRRVLTSPELRAYYLESLERCILLAGGPGGWLEQEIERQYQQIRQAAILDPNKPFSNAQFEEGVANLRYFAFERPRAITSQIAFERGGSAAPIEPPPEDPD